MDWNTYLTVKQLCGRKAPCGDAVQTVATFSLLGKLRYAFLTAVGTVKMAAGCCSLGTNGNAATGFDCAVIPGASKSPTAATITRLPGSALNFCGGKLGTIAGATDAKTVCCEITFSFHFRYGRAKNSMSFKSV